MCGSVLLFMFRVCLRCTVLSVPGSLMITCWERAGLEVIKLEFILELKIKRNDWLLADTCPPAANHCALF